MLPIAVEFRWECHCCSRAVWEHQLKLQSIVECERFPIKPVCLVKATAGQSKFGKPWAQLRARAKAGPRLAAQDSHIKESDHRTRAWQIASFLLPLWKCRNCRWALLSADFIATVIAIAFIRRILRPFRKFFNPKRVFSVYKSACSISVVDWLCLMLCFYCQLLTFRTEK